MPWICRLEFLGWSSVMPFRLHLNLCGRRTKLPHLITVFLLILILAWLLIFPSLFILHFYPLSSFLSLSLFLWALAIIWALAILWLLSLAPLNRSRSVRTLHLIPCTSPLIYFWFPSSALIMQAWFQPFHVSSHNSLAISQYRKNRLAILLACFPLFLQASFRVLQVLELILLE